MSNSKNFLVPILLLGLILFTGCATQLRNRINRAYPPISPLEKDIVSVQRSLSTLAELKTVDLGIKIDKDLLNSNVAYMLRKELEKNPTLGIKNVASIKIDNVKFLCAQQELILDGTFEISFSNLPLTSLKVNLRGQVSPSIRNDSLILAPSFTTIKILDSKFIRKFFLVSKAKNLVNSLVKEFMDNVNGAIKDYYMRIDYQPMASVALSSLFKGDQSISVTNDYSISLRKKLAYPVIYIDTNGIKIVTQIVDAVQAVKSIAVLNLQDRKDVQHLMCNSEVLIKDESAATTTILRTSTQDSDYRRRLFYRIEAGNPKPSKRVNQRIFDSLFALFNQYFIGAWNLNLDTITNARTSEARISQSFISNTVNEIFSNPQFCIQYDANNLSANIDKKEFKILESPHVDCGQLAVHCELNDCSRVLSNCCGCNWHSPGCCLAWVPCQTANGVKWAACQSANALKLTACGVETAARTALCGVEIVGKLVAYEALRVGYISGKATASAQINGCLDNLSLDSKLSTIKCNTHFRGSGDADVTLQYDPTGLIGHLVCTWGFNKTFNQHVIAPSQGLSLTGNITKTTLPDNTVASLKIKTEELILHLDFQPPLAFQLIKNPDLVINCQIGLFGVALWSGIKALTGDKDYQNYLSAALTGLYKHKLSPMEFSVPINSISIKTPEKTENFKCQWGVKSLILTN